ncbi:MAG: tRNA (N6-threonylcarbamoyladenosine(37)-N6)-methyltransferase TrmO [Clostridia bacterium]|nr:tRNA (N6-threonylcarbamoyladenosine(37)-N6)-methyltransferase TrmO [Clostridia bacterium]
MEISPIAEIRCGFSRKFGLPRQSGYVPELKGTVVFRPGYRIKKATEGLESFSHIWIIWGFSEGFASEPGGREPDDWDPAVRPPKLGGNARVGVFATRSPNRPNRLALSAVKIEAIRDTEESGTVIDISGIDMTDGTPVYDIKPYIPYSDSIPGALPGISEDPVTHRLEVTGISELDALSPDDRRAVIGCLEKDPRPGYITDPGRVYTMTYSVYEISFRVEGNVLTVTGCVPGQTDA